MWRVRPWPRRLIKNRSNASPYNLLGQQSQVVLLAVATRPSAHGAFFNTVSSRAGALVTEIADERRGRWRLARFISRAWPRSRGRRHTAPANHSSRGAEKRIGAQAAAAAFWLKLADA